MGYEVLQNTTKLNLYNIKIHELWKHRGTNIILAKKLTYKAETNHYPQCLFLSVHQHKKSVRVRQGPATLQAWTRAAAVLIFWSLSRGWSPPLCSPCEFHQSYPDRSVSKALFYALRPRCKRHMITASELIFYRPDYQLFNRHLRRLAAHYASLLIPRNASNLLHENVSFSRWKDSWCSSSYGCSLK